MTTEICLRWSRRAIDYLRKRAVDDRDVRALPARAKLGLAPGPRAAACLAHSESL